MEIPGQIFSGFTVTSVWGDVAGGIMESRATSPNLHKYNPVCNDSTRLAPMEVARFGHCAVVLDDLIYAIVGSGGVGEHWRSIYV